MTILEKIDYLMKINGLNRHSLAIQSGIPYTTIDGWYKRGWEKMHITSLKNLSKYFNVSLEFWDDEVELGNVNDELLEFLPYLKQADEKTLEIIRTILHMPQKKS